MGFFRFGAKEMSNKKLTALKLTTVENAMNLLTELGLVESYIEWEGELGTERKYVEGKALLNAMGIAYSDRDWSSKLARVNKKNGFREWKDYEKVDANLITAIEGCNQKSGAKSKIYLYEPLSAAEAVLSAHTPKGKAGRKGIIQTTLNQAETIQAKNTALTAIKEASNEEDIRGIAEAGLKGDMHEIMLLARPARRLAKLIEADSNKPLDKLVEEFIAASRNNTKATYEDRIRMAQSLRDMVHKAAEKLIIAHVKDGGKVSQYLQERERADRLITKYERSLARYRGTAAINELQYYRTH